MNIIVAGMGEVGKHIAFMLALENNNVIIIDSDSDILVSAEEKMDVMAVNGHAASPKTLKTAKIDKCDLFVSVTSNDEVNILACNLAKAFGASKTIARVSNKEFLPDGRGFYHNYLGSDLILNPNILTAIEISKMIKNSSNFMTYEFCENKIQCIEIVITENSKMVNQELYNVNMSDDIQIVGIFREHKFILPSADETLKINDHVFFLGKVDDQSIVEKSFDLAKEMKSNKVMLVGGSDIALEIAFELERLNIQCVIIDTDRERCEFFSDQLTKTEVVCGDATNPVFLEEEHISQVNVFVALSMKDEINLMTALLAKREGVAKTISLTKKSSYLNIYEQLGVDISISPRLLAAKQVLKFIRRANVINSYLFEDNETELIEILIDKDSKVIGSLIKDLQLPYGIKPFLIQKNNGKIFEIEEQIELEENDSMILLSKRNLRDSIERLFKKK